MERHTTTQLLDAILLADKVSPTPTEAHRALRLLRAAYADACAMTIDELASQAAAYKPDAGSALAHEFDRQA